MTVAEEILRELEQLKSSRQTWESVWQEVADYVLPKRGTFNSYQPSPGARRDRKLYDSTGQDANEMLADGLAGLLTGPAQKWFTLRYHRTNRKLDSIRAKQWLDDVQEVLYGVFNSPRSGFQSNIHELYLDLGALGTGIFYIQDDQESIVLYRTRHLGECWVREDSRGVVDTLYREFEYTLRQAYQEWGWKPKNMLPDEINKKMDDKFVFVHCVKPNTQFDAGKYRTRTNKPWVSIYVTQKDKEVVAAGGFDSFPFCVPRWQKRTREVYGYSPALRKLPDIKMLNEMRKTVIKAAQKIVDPPLMLPDDGFLGPIRTVPGGLNFYKANSQDRIEPLETKGRPDIGIDMINQVAQSVMRGFYADAFRMPDSKEGVNVKAAWVVQRREEVMRQLSPVLSRQEAELLSPTVARTYLIASNAGVLPLAPPEVIESRAMLDIEYVGPLARAQKTTEGDDLLRWLNLIAPIGQMDPSVYDAIDGDEYVKYTGTNVYTVPAHLLRDETAIAQIRQDRAKRQQAQEAVALGQGAAGALRDVAAARQDLG